MRIAIDARMMGPSATRGIGRYIEELVRALLEIAPEHTYILIVRQAGHPFVNHPSVETVVVNVPWYGIWEQIRLPFVFRRTRANIVHVPHWNVPLTYHGPLVVTVHDLLLRHEPSSAKASTRSALTRWLKRVGYHLTIDHAIAVARRVLVPTRFVADDVVTFYPNAKSKIRITGEGMPAWQGEEVEDHTDAAVSPYLLYVGSAYPHKGLDDLLDAWKTIARNYPQLRLLFAGEMDVFMSRLRARVDQEQLPRVKFLGRVTDEQLLRLYRDAYAFVYPTHFEGFGLPPLEAVAAGCPVISSDAGPLKEVLTSDGAIFFRAGDVDGIIHAVTDAMGNPTELRQNRVKLAQLLMEKHDWKAAAARTLAAYQEAFSWQEAQNDTIKL